MSSEKVHVPAPAALGWNVIQYAPSGPVQLSDFLRRYKPVQPWEEKTGNIPRHTLYLKDSTEPMLWVGGQ